MSTTARLKLIAAIQAASIKIDQGTYRPQLTPSGACLVVWELGDQEDVVAIIEPGTGRITWSGKALRTKDLKSELAPLGMTEAWASPGSPIMQAARAELMGVFS